MDSLVASADAIDRGEPNDAHTTHVARITIASSSPTSVCSIAMFMYPSKHAKIPTAINTRVVAPIPSVIIHASSTISVGTITTLERATDGVRTSIIHPRVQLHAHFLALDGF
jgi:hypothetical protein